MCITLQGAGARVASVSRPASPSGSTSATLEPRTHYICSDCCRCMADGASRRGRHVVWRIKVASRRGWALCCVGGRLVVYHARTHIYDASLRVGRVSERVVRAGCHLCAAGDCASQWRVINHDSHSTVNVAQVLDCHEGVLWGLQCRCIHELGYYLYLDVARVCPMREREQAEGKQVNRLRMFQGGCGR